jgi:hypothetical protein
MVVISLLVIQRGGGKWGLALTLISPPFIFLIWNGSIEWIPALAFLLSNKWSTPLLLAKPQSGLLAALAWSHRWQDALPALAVVIGSFMVWGNWLAAMLANMAYQSAHHIGLWTVDISPFPLSIPVGVLVAWLAWRARSDVLATAATLLLVPYFVSHSLTSLLALLAGQHKRIALALWLICWASVAWQIGMM